MWIYIANIGQCSNWDIVFIKIDFMKKNKSVNI